MALNIFKAHHLNGQIGVEAAAKALVGQITAAPSAADELNNIHWDILHFSRAYPGALDFPLHVHQRILSLLPADMKIGYGTGGPEGARRSFSWFLNDMVRTLEGHGATEPEDVGDSDDKDWDYEGPEYANVAFSRDEVANNLNDVLAKTLDLGKLRRETVIDWAVGGRAHALDAARVGRGHEAWIAQNFYTALLPASLEGKGMPPWSKADFIAACVGMRATAKTILDEMTSETREDNIKLWTGALKEFLLEGEQALDDKNNKYRDGDFVVKYHAALVLKNLLGDPRDETSEELFNAGKWVF